MPLPRPPPCAGRVRWRSPATLALIVLGLAWELWLAPTGRGTLAIKVLPLLLPLPGLLRLRLYTYRWLSLGVWLYVAEGAVRAGSEHGISASLALLEVALAPGPLRGLLHPRPGATARRRRGRAVAARRAR